MKLSREKIQRMIEGNRGGSSGSGGGSSIAGGASQAWVNQNYVSIEFFRKVFKVWAAGATSSDPDVEIVPNDIASTVKNIQAQAGLWTESFLSALGNGGGGGTGGASTLDQLDDVVITSPINGQALIYNATTQMWVNGTIQSGTDMATVWAALAAATNEPINASHLSGVLADYVTTTSLQTILGDYLTQTAADQRYITIAYFDRLFRAYNGSTLVSHNDTTSTIDNIKAMFGFWTDLYISALGSNSAATGLGIDNLTDVTINTPTDGQVLQYNATSSKWENATIQTVVALSGLTDVLLTSVTDSDILRYNSNTQKWENIAIKTINGYSIFGSGNINISGGGSGNYMYINTRQGWNANLCYENAGLYMIKGGSNLPSGSQVGAVLFLPYRAGTGNTKPDFGVQLFGPNGDDRTNPDSLYYRTSEANSFRSWQEVITDRGGQTINNTLQVAKIKIEYTNEINSYQDYQRLHLNYRSIGYVTICGGGGSVSIGSTNAPSYKLDVLGSIGGHSVSINNNGRINIKDEPSNCNLYIGNSNNSGWVRLQDICSASGNTGDNSDWSIRTNGNARFANVYSSGYVTALSDARKKDITGEADVSVEQIAHAPAVLFLWKGERAKEGLQVGTLAQYWQTVLPEVVLDKGGELSMQYGVAALVSAITIARKVVDHEQRIRQLEKENEELKKQLNAA